MKGRREKREGRRDEPVTRSKEGEFVGARRSERERKRERRESKEGTTGSYREKLDICSHPVSSITKATLLLL